MRISNLCWASLFVLFACRDDAGSSDGTGGASSSGVGAGMPTSSGTLSTASVGGGNGDGDDDGGICLRMIDAHTSL